jgi:hypothetical protein
MYVSILYRSVINQHLILKWTFHGYTIIIHPWIVQISVRVNCVVSVVFVGRSLRLPNTVEELNLKFLFLLLISYSLLLNPAYFTLMGNYQVHILISP